jgi:predicted Zn-dependent protease
MKRAVLLITVLACACAAVWFSERKKTQVEVAPTAVLDMIADAQRELTRPAAALTRMSDSEEERLGARLAEEYYGELHQANTPDDDRIALVVERIGDSLAAHAHRNLPFHFHYIGDRNFENAFSLPGGHVYIGRGLIRLFTTEDEIAAVLAHEIEHVDHYHCAERFQTEAALRKLDVLGAVASIPVTIFQMGYSKNQEAEADREGTMLAVRSDYSPYGALDAFSALEHELNETPRRPANPGEEAAGVVVGTLEGYFRSHPPISERIALVQRLIASEGWQKLKQQRPFDSATPYRASAF